MTCDVSRCFCGCAFTWPCPTSTFRRCCVHAQVLRVHVTPTRLKFLAPEDEMGNRVVRYFSSEEGARR